MPSNNSTKSSKRQVKVGNFIVGKTLGAGAFAKVRACTHALTGEAFAMKLIDRDMIARRGLERALKREVRIARQVKHRNIVRMHSLLSSKSRVFMVMEQCNGGELLERILNDGVLPEDEAQTHFAQLCLALEYCHSRGIYHRDLKPANILFKDGILKLADFGLASVTDAPGAMLKTACGTPNYVAPEVIDGVSGPYDGALADIWGAGVVLFSMLSACLPFDEPNMADLYKRILSADYDMLPEIPEGAKDLIRRILVVDPAKRADMDAIMSHPWLAEAVARERALASAEAEIDAAA